MEKCIYQPPQVNVFDVGVNANLLIGSLNVAVAKGVEIEENFSRERRGGNTIDDSWNGSSNDLWGNVW